MGWEAKLRRGHRDALVDTAPDLRRYFDDAGSDVGEKMLAAWSAGIADSLGLAGDSHQVLTPAATPPGLTV